MADLKGIYQSESERYHALVSREDYQNNLLPAILAIDPLCGKHVVELGAGTGRISCQIAPLVNRLIVGDISHHMLRFGRNRLIALGLNNWQISMESHTDLPFTDNCADVVIAGWSFCYVAIDAGENWQISLEKALSQIARILRPGGKLILIESLGTGFETPKRPAVLKTYLGYLDKHGFNTSWIRTDYLFNNLSEARDLTAFFFGEEPMPMQETTTGVIVPECTGLWWKEFE